MLVEMKKLNKRERAVVTSLDVAETFTYYDEENKKEYTREHKAVLRAIRELRCSEEFRGEHFSPSNYTDSRGKEQPCVLMDKDGFTMLVMGFNDPKAVKFKEIYINQFNQMEELLKGKLIEREKGIAVRNALTKAIEISGENERMHNHAYSNYTDHIIYKQVFGMRASELREKYAIGKKDDLRSCFTEEELRKVQNAEMLVSSLIEYGWGFDEIKDFVLKNVDKLNVA